MALICTNLTTNDVEPLMMWLLGTLYLWRNVYSIPMSIFSLFVVEF